MRNNQQMLYFCSTTFLYEKELEYNFNNGCEEINEKSTYVVVYVGR